MIFVTNKGSQPLVAKYVDQWFEFMPGKSVGVEPHVARHIFGYGDDNKYTYLVRLGWMKMNTDYDKAMSRLKEFSFTDAPVKNDQQSAVLVDRVAPPALRGRAGAKVQPSTSNEA
jgi:hypothetical protein